MPRTVASYRVLVGLEIHVQLATKSKMFTGAKNGFSAEPNTQVDPMVMGLPGTLPVINQQAVEYSVMTGLALGCEISKHSKWDRKSYYYPDLPKNYQISQYDQPLCGEGSFELDLPDGKSQTVRIRRAHLEEDAGKLLHEAPGGFAIDYSIVDLNRAGTPLLEIVTEPDFDSPQSVSAFGQELQKLVQYLGVSDGQMQLGNMRFEPNINVHITDGEGNVHKTAITEIKNLNSFSVLEKATAYEIRRQIDTWVQTGDLGKKATYGWDDVKQQTVLQREKEEAHDYRYFPDPDLLPVEISDAWLTEIKSKIGELPAARRRRYLNELKLQPADAEYISGRRTESEYFETLLAGGIEPKRAATVMETLREMTNDKQVSLAELKLSPQAGVEVSQLAKDGKIAASKEVARKVLEHVAEHGGTATAAAESLGLVQTTDTGAIDAAIDAVLAQNPKPLQDYRGGKQAALGGLVGMIMKSGKGLNAALVKQRLMAKL